MASEHDIASVSNDIMIPVNLEDAETQQIYSIFVTAEQAERLKTDKFIIQNILIRFDVCHSFIYVLANCKADLLVPSYLFLCIFLYFQIELMLTRCSRRLNVVSLIGL